MSIIVTIILGGIVGWIASQIMSRQEGLFADSIIGIVGSFIGSFISELFTGSDHSYLSFSWTGLVWSLIGAVVLMAVIKAVRGPRHHIA